MLPLKSVLGILGLLYTGISLVTLVSCVVYLLKSLGFRSLKVAHITREHIEFFDQNDLATIYRGYAIRYCKDREFNSYIINTKAATLHWSYRMIVTSSCFLVLSALLYVLYTSLLKYDCSWMVCGV